MVAHQPLELRVMVRIHAGQPFCFALQGVKLLWGFAGIVGRMLLRSQTGVSVWNGEAEQKIKRHYDTLRRDTERIPETEG